MRERVRGIDRLAAMATVAKAVRYSAVSLVGVMVTQLLLLFGHSILGVSPGWANVGAVLLSAVPVYVLNRVWVWQLRGPSSLRREVLPFWAFTVAGLVLSTLAVTGVASLTDSTVAVSAANIGAFGVLWVAKFFVLDGVVFSGVAAHEAPDRGFDPLGSLRPFAVPELASVGVAARERAPGETA